MPQGNVSVVRNFSGMYEMLSGLLMASSARLLSHNSIGIS